MILLEVALISSFIAVAIASDDEGYICNGTTTMFDPPQDLTQSVLYPTGWTEQQPPAKFAPNQKCFWTVNIPQDMYAQVVFYKLTDPGYDIAVEYPNMRIENLANNDHMPYNFVAPYATFLMYQSNMNGAFSFKITWSKYPSGNKNTVYIQSGAAPVALAPNSGYTTFQADTRVALAGFNTKDPSDMPLLRQTAVFAGGSTDGEFIGTLAQVWRSSDQVVTVNDKLTVFTFDLHKHITYPMFVAQDYSDCNYLGRIQGYNCPDTGDCPIEINSVYSPSAIITIGDNSDFVKTFNYFNENSTLKIYEGGISDDHQVATVTKTNQNQLPIRVNNYMKHYVLDHVRTEMVITKDANNAKWNRVSSGRKGVIHSYNYGYNKYAQDTDETFTTYEAEQIYFSLTVKNADLQPTQSTLNVRVLSNGNVVYGKIFSSSSPPPTLPITALGDTLKVTYKTNGEESYGFWMDFEASQDNNPTVSQTSTSTVTSPKVITKTAATMVSTAQSSTKTTVQSTAGSTAITSRPLSTQPTRSHVETTTSGGSSDFVVMFISFVLLIVHF